MIRSFRSSVFLAGAVGLAGMLATAAPASAQTVAGAAVVTRGNDTSGIIPWSRAAEFTAKQAAQAHCGGYGKFARITGVHRKPGQFISFNCLWRPGIARDVLPEVRLAQPRCHIVREVVDGRVQRLRVCETGAAEVLDQQVVLRRRG